MNMVGAFNGSEWCLTDGRIISRDVTSCADMTAYMSLLAQTKVGFLTGGRGNTFMALEETENNVQREEVHARATVALTRAQRFCFVMCLLDMKGLVGAATVVGSLQHGSGICEQRVQGDLLRVALRAENLSSSHLDEKFLRNFRMSATRADGKPPCSSG